MSATAPLQVAVSARGEVGDADRRYARDRVLHACSIAPRPILAARVALTREADPALERPCVVKASADVSGRVVRAHVAARTMHEAIDLLEARLRRRLEALSEHDEARRQQTGLPAPGEWRHGDLPAARPEYFPRPVEERRLVRRKTFAPAALTPAEAAWDMELLDHDFHLFTDAGSGEEALVFRRPDGTLGLQQLEPARGGGAYVEPFRIEAAAAPALLLDDAIAFLDGGDEPFVFFRDPRTGRGRVVYRRYDGHYGLITPADAP